MKKTVRTKRKVADGAADVAQDRVADVQAGASNDELIEFFHERLDGEITVLDDANPNEEPTWILDRNVAGQLYIKGKDQVLPTSGD